MTEPEPPGGPLVSTVSLTSVIGPRGGFHDTGDSASYRNAASTQGADRALASRVQHDPAAQLAGLSAAGTGGGPAVSTGFRYAPAGENGLCSNIGSGTTNGGRSVEGGTDRTDNDGSAATVFPLGLGRGVRPR